MNEDRITGQRAGIRWAIAWLHKRAEKMSYASDTVLVRAVAKELALEARRLRTEELSFEGWQDIATAPRDGTVVDLWLQSLIWLADGGQQVAVEFRVADAVWLDQQWCDTDGNPHPWIQDWKGEGIRITHWMPPPPPPDTADDITAGLEALSEPIVAEWGEVKDRLGLARDAHTKEQT